MITKRTVTRRMLEEDGRATPAKAANLKNNPEGRRVLSSAFSGGRGGIERKVGLMGTQRAARAWTV